MALLRLVDTTVMILLSQVLLEMRKLSNKVCVKLQHLFLHQYTFYFKVKKHDSKSYLESMNKIEMWREKDIRPIMKELIMMFSHDLGSPLLENEFDFSFNSLETIDYKGKRLIL